ncbi:helix-turn-helix domain-containing protein [Aeoliella sp. ICT_H6.2]|uniref:Helix-turn-helix domain-containing protein n=1 Tax=Aeoliella straminimaris TaxID=2954799 RepID=A0A9X2FEH4_9BACT|nr:helix-turn-helix transcriptional regulator [Aeoliella straminimaris]MCO6046688.1 helix-turn-helix domain-containing protein [Aeoliella straminimaris]
MLSQSEVQQIVELLERNELTRRQIAQRVGVSHSSVYAIASGRRGLFSRDSDEHAPSQRATRCPTCGVRVYLPCVACRAREFHLRTRRRGHRQFAGVEAATCFAPSQSDRVA